MRTVDHEPRLLVVPGLNDSGPGHWQSWLQSQFRDARRVEQRDWSRPDLDRWAERVGSTLDRAGGEDWIAHINAEAGFASLPLARRWVTTMQARLARERRFERADWAEWSFAV